MTSEMIDTKQLEIDAEYINNAMEMAERGAAMAVTGAITAGVRLIEVKKHIPHGEWASWIGRNLNYSQAKAIRYMRIASNSSCVINLKDASSINEALRMIADDKPETVPRSDRKPADVVVSVPTETCYRDDSRAATTEAPDDDPTPDMPTNRKTAKGSEKIPEDKKPRTQTVPVEIIDDEPKEILPEEKTLADFTFKEILEFISDSAAGDEKIVAKQLRKLADTLDPPTKFVKPDLDEVSEYFKELNAVDPDSFFDFYESKGWLVGKVSMKDWRASASKWVRESTSSKWKGKRQWCSTSGN
jgi:hypothetical protein